VRFAAFLALISLACATSDPARTASSPSADLRTIADEVWSHQLERNIGARLRLGLPIERMPDPSHAHAAREATVASQVLERLNAIDVNALTEDERVTLGILRWQQRMTVDGLPHFWLRFQVTPYASAVRTTNEVFSQFVFHTPGDGQRYLRLLRDYARFIDALAEVVKEQQRRGVLIPQPELPLVQGMFAVLRGTPERSPFAVVESRLSRLDATDRASFLEGVPEAIVSVVNPALQRLSDVLSSEYEKAAPKTVGISQYPGGREAYRYLMRLGTSLELSPEEVHDLGLREIERIEHELDAIRNEVGFRGGRDEFLRFLKTDPRFFETSAEGIRNRLQRHVTKIEPHLPRFFARMPRAAYGVQRLGGDLRIREHGVVSEVLHRSLT